MVLYSAADLIWATRIKSTADDLAIPCRPARNAQMLRARLADSQVRAVLFDLEAPERAWEMLGALRGPGADERTRAITVIAWGPHVMAERLGRADELGADEVMTRGAFSAGLADLLIRLGRPSRGDG